MNALSTIATEKTPKKKGNTSTEQKLALRIATLLDDKKAQNIVILDLRGEASYTDFLVIASGTSERHVGALGEHIMGTFKQEGTLPVGSEGFRDCDWALVDYGSVVVHVFQEFTRELYDLEAIWKDSPQLPFNPSAA